MFLAAFMRYSAWALLNIEVFTKSVLFFIREMCSREAERKEECNAIAWQKTHRKNVESILTFYSEFSVLVNKFS